MRPSHSIAFAVFIALAPLGAEEARPAPPGADPAAPPGPAAPAPAAEKERKDEPPADDPLPPAPAVRYVGPTLAPDLQVHVGSHSGHGHGGGNVHIDDDFAVVALIAVAAAVAVVTPIAVLDDGYDADAVLPPWPYAVGGGYLDLAHEPQGIADRIAVVGEAWVAGATDDRTMIGARARFDTTWRVGVEGAWTQIHRSEFDAEPFARFGDLLATWRFAQHPRAQFHVGIGGRTLHLDDGDRSGGALAYGFDIFPIRRVVAHGSVGYAKAGGIDCSHGRIAVGVVVNIFECFVGYEYERFDHDHPHGPMIGVRAWF